MAHYKDLRDAYAKQMEFHGAGLGLFNPISALDMIPPCAGYYDRNGDWTLIAKLSTQTVKDGDVEYVPLTNEPTKVSDLGIIWQPKTSLGVQQTTVDASGATPSNLPGGADAHIKYKSSSKFGAVLMTVRPITLTAYNQERLFVQWLESNKYNLYERHGTELKKYGMWIVTRTYTAPGCSICAWNDSGKAAIVTLKAKASMLGEVGEDVDWSEKLQDRDWSHYKATTPQGLVVFMDGIEIKSSKWWLESIRHTFASKSRDSSQHRARASISAEPLQRPQENPTSAQTRRGSNDLRRRSYLAQEDEFDSEKNHDDVLRDLGVRHALARSPGSRRNSSYTASVRSQQKSLRRESRVISAHDPDDMWQNI